MLICSPNITREEEYLVHELRMVWLGEAKGSREQKLSKASQVDAQF